MALVLSFDICQEGNCKYLKFRELTGLYSSINTTGWGTPNADLSDANTATLTIENIDSGTSYTIDLTAHGFPTINTYYFYPFDSTYLGDATASAIEDGNYLFTYTITTDTDEYTTSVRKLLYCNIECCVLGMFSGIDFDCDCSKDEQENAIKAYTILQGLKYAASCGNVTSFNNNLLILERLCNNSNCKTC